MQSDFVLIDGTTTRKASLLSLSDVINPPASQAEAEAGTDAVKRMTPLTTAQAIDAQVSPAGLSGAYADLTGKPTLGTSAALNVGTSSGTVAAGDDPRIVNAYQPLATSAGTTDARNRLSSLVSQIVSPLFVQGLGPDGPGYLPLLATGSKTYEVDEQKTTHTDGAFFTKAIIKQSSGSGAFGPQAADGALILCAEKVTYDGSGNRVGGWLTAQGEGEIDTLEVFARQGHKGDTAGIAVDVRKVRTGASGETGGGTPIEVASAIVNESDVPSLSMHWIPGMTETAAGLSGGKGYGNWVETRAGKWYSAFYAGNVGAASSDNENPALGDDTFENIVVASTSRNPAGTDVIFRIGGSAEPGGLVAAVFQGKPANQTVGWHNPGTSAYEWRTGGGVIKMTLGSTGVLTPAAGLQIGSGSVETYMRVVKGAVTYASGNIPANTTVALGNVACAGCLVGDMVTVAYTGTAGGAASLDLSGVIYVNGTVTLLGRNTTTAAVNYGSIDYTAKVERFA